MKPDGRRPNIGGVVHTYQKYDPLRLPAPGQAPPDLVSPLMNQMLAMGSFRPLTEAELARAIRLDPQQMAGLGPSLDLIRELLLERKRRILEKYETETVVRLCNRRFQELDSGPSGIPPRFQREYRRAVDGQQLYALEQLWFLADGKHPEFALQLLALIGRLGEKYQVDGLVANYSFTGRDPLTVELAIQIREELEKIDALLRQLDELEKNARIGFLDLDQLREFVDPQNSQALAEMQRTMENLVRELAERQGLTREGGRFRITPRAMRIFQGKLLERIFSELQAGRSGRHVDNITGEGAVELQKTRPWEFGDPLANLDLTESFTNAILRCAQTAPESAGSPFSLRLDPRDLIVHETRNTPKCATVMILDMSGSMRHGGQYIQVKRMALAMDALIRSGFPGDYLGFVEMCTFARVKSPGEIIGLMPKPVTIFDPVVQMRVDMSRERVSEHMLPQHFTNIQHALAQARRLLAAQDTPNKQVILITDGLPTAHFEGSMLYMLYPPHPVTEEATLREGMLCKQQGLVLNLFLIDSWSQSEADIQFAQRLAQNTGGRVFFPGGEDLDRFVVWDYVKRRREILG